MPESGHYARRIYFNLYLRKVPLPELPFHLPCNCPEPDNAANFPSRPSRLTRLFLFRFFPSFQNEKCTPHTFPQIYKFIFVQQIFSPFLVIDSIESFLSSGIRNIFSFEKFVHPRNISDRGRGTRVRNTLRYIYPPLYLLASWLGYRLHPKNARSIPSIGFRRDFERR